MGFNFKKGFSLLEVIVSITVFLAAMIGVIGLLSFNIVNAALLRNRLIAANLAQEGIEVVRNIRDNNFLMQEVATSTPWDLNLSGGSFRVDYKSQSLLPFSSTPLNFHVSVGLYDYDSVPPSDTVVSIFSRSINIQKINDHEIKVEAIVTWKERGKDMPPLSVEDHLFNWK